MSYNSRKAMAQAIEKGQAWLEKNAKTMMAETDTGLEFKDNFLEFLILEATGNWRLVDLRIPPKKWNYFGGKAVVTADPYPDDVDTQCIANTVMKPQDATAHALLDEILEKAVSEDGIVTLYFDNPARLRICVEVCANVCTFFYTYGRGAQVRKTFDLVYNTLKSRDFGVKRYYFTPEPLFYYVCRMVHAYDGDDAPELKEMRDVLRECVTERIGADDDNAIVLAIRLLVCQKLGVPNEKDLQALLKLQEDDGGFGVGWYYNFGRSGVKIGHRGFTAAFSVEAIKTAMAAKDQDLNEGSKSMVSTKGKNGGIIAWIKWLIGLVP